MPASIEVEGVGNENGWIKICQLMRIVIKPFWWCLQFSPSIPGMGCEAACTKSRTPLEKEKCDLEIEPIYLVDETLMR